MAKEAGKQLPLFKLSEIKRPIVVPRFMPCLECEGQAENTDARGDGSGLYLYICRRGHVQRCSEQDFLGELNRRTNKEEVLFLTQ